MTMRNISFALTTEQIRNRTKTVTRRLGWKNLKPGTLLQACVKCMGLKPGEKIEKLCVIRVTKVDRVELFWITDEDVEREGFPGKGWEWFIDLFCSNMHCHPTTEVTRIEFEYCDTPTDQQSNQTDFRQGCRTCRKNF